MKLLLLFFVLVTSSAASAQVSKGVRTLPDSRSSADISAVISKNQPLIEALYKDAQKKNSKLTGELKIRLVIGTTGSVKETGVKSSSLPDKTLESQILATVKKFAFPAIKASAGDQKVDVPYNFSPTE
jgi:TonB family protein